MVLAMLRDLPAGSRLQARTYGQREAQDGQGQAQVDWYWERRRWGTPERELLAAILNRLGDVVKYTPQWQKGKSPDFPIVGPPEWRGEGPETEKRPASIEDAMRVFGWLG